MLLNGPAFSDDRLVRGDYALKPPSQNLAAGARAFFQKRQRGSANLPKMPSRGAGPWLLQKSAK